MSRKEFIKLIKKLVPDESADIEYILALNVTKEDGTNKQIMHYSGSNAGTLAYLNTMSSKQIEKHIFPKMKFQKI